MDNKLLSEKDRRIIELREQARVQILIMFLFLYVSPCGQLYIFLYVSMWPVLHASPALGAGPGLPGRGAEAAE